MAGRHRAIDGLVRGFTLVELAVSLAVVGVLTVASIIGGQAYLRMAREQRTSAELRGLVVLTRNLAMRGFTSNVVAANAAAAALITSAAADYDAITTATSSTAVRTFAGVDIGSTDVCFDLSSNACTAVAGNCWGAARARNETTPSTELDRLMGLNSGGTGGVNQYGQPIATCVLSRRVEVRTCLPTTEVPRDLSLAGCPAVAAYACPVGMACYSVGASLLPPNLARLAFAYRAQYWGEATTVGP